MTSSYGEGVVKYQSVHQRGEVLFSPRVDQLDKVRTQLFDLSLIGVYPDGVGYGNVSIRSGTGCVISGTATGGIRVLGLAGYCEVVRFDLQQNLVHTVGPVPASSEAMTHCAIYAADERVNCVLHIHSESLWQRLLEYGSSTTAKEIEYGTPEMAEAIANCVREINSESGVIVMAGHVEGVVAYGTSIQNAFREIRTLVEDQQSRRHK